MHRNISTATIVPTTMNTSDVGGWFDDRDLEGEGDFVALAVAATLAEAGCRLGEGSDGESSGDNVPILVELEVDGDGTAVGEDEKMFEDGLGISVKDDERVMDSERVEGGEYKRVALGVPVEDQVRDTDSDNEAEFDAEGNVGLPTADTIEPTRYSTPLAPMAT